MAVEAFISPKRSLIRLGRLQKGAKWSAMLGPNSRSNRRCPGQRQGQPDLVVLEVGKGEVEPSHVHAEACKEGLNLKSKAKEMCQPLTAIQRQKWMICCKSILNWMNSIPGQDIMLSNEKSLNINMYVNRRNTRYLAVTGPKWALL